MKLRIPRTKKEHKAMLDDQNFTAKDCYLLGASFFRHPKHGIDYALAHNYKMSGILHEHLSFSFLCEEPGDEKMFETLEKFGCPFGGKLVFVSSRGVHDGMLPPLFNGYSVIYSEKLKHDLAAQAGPRRRANHQAEITGAWMFGPPEEVLNNWILELQFPT